MAGAVVLGFELGTRPGFVHGEAREWVEGDGLGLMGRGRGVGESIFRGGLDVFGDGGEGGEMDLGMLLWKGEEGVGCG
jgi:hypothetical protein